MRAFRLMILLIALLYLGACGGGGTITLPGGGGDHDTEIAAMLSRHNATRAGLGLAAFTQNTLLNQIAQDQANYMASSGHMVHTDASGHQVDWRATAIGYSWSEIGENIGYSTSPADLYNGWLGSAGHYANIINGAFHEIGIGVADAGVYQYWCIDFGG
jgi:uncharacterized protein YkwD